MIKLIKDGALPHPAKCIVCGYAGNERFYYWFKYKEKWGQVLICTTCMKEAATLDESFIPMEMVQPILDTNYALRAENDRLELATERFTDKFAGLVTNFLMDIGGALPPTSQEEPDPEKADEESVPVVDGDGREPETSTEPAGTDGVTSVDELWDSVGVIDKPFG